MTKRYRITLEAEERDHLRQLLSKGGADVRRLKHAQILLAADESDAGPALSDDQISRTVDVARATVERIRQRFVEEGLELSLSPYRTPSALLPEVIAGVIFKRWNEARRLGICRGHPLLLGISR